MLIIILQTRWAVKGLLFAKQAFYPRDTFAFVSTSFKQVLETIITEVLVDGHDRFREFDFGGVLRIAEHVVEVVSDDLRGCTEIINLTLGDVHEICTRLSAPLAGDDEAVDIHREMGGDLAVCHGKVRQRRFVRVGHVLT